MDKVSAATKALNDAIAAQVNPVNRARQAQDDYAKQEAKNAANRETYWVATKKQFEQEEAAWRRMQGVHEQALKQNAAMNQEFANSVQQWITNPLAMAGQAAGKFAADYGKIGVAALGIGTAAGLAGKMVFDLTRQVGAAAIEMRNLATRTGMGVESAQTFSLTAGVMGVNPGALTTAMRTLSQGLSDVSGEGRKAKEALAQIGIAGYQAFLPMDQLMPLIFDHLRDVGNAVERDRLAIALFGRGGLELMPLVEQFREMSGQVTATGAVIGRDGIQKLVEYEEHMRLIGLRWQAMKNILAQDAVGIIEFVIKGSQFANPLGYQKAIADDQALSGVNGGIPMPAAPGVPDAAALQRAGRTGYVSSYTQNLGSPQDRLKAQIEGLQDDRKAAVEKYVSGSGTFGPVEDIDKKIAAAKAAEQAAKDAIKYENQLAEARKKVAGYTERAVEAEDKAGSATPLQRRMGEQAAIESQRTARMGDLSDSLNGRVPSDLIAGVNQAAAIEQASSVKKYQAEVAKNAQGLADALERATLAVDSHYRSAVDTSLKRTEKLDDDPVTRMLMATMPTQLPAGTPTAQLIQRMQMTAGANLNISKLGQTAGTKASMTQSGDDETANQILKMQVAYNNTVLSKQEAEAANEKALSENIDRRYANQLKYEEELAALQEAQQKAFQSKAVDLFHSLLTGHGAQFGRSLGMGMADKVVGNAAGMGFEQFNLGGVVPQISSGPLGALLKGTPLNTGIGSSDPINKNSGWLEVVSGDLKALHGDISGSASVGGAASSTASPDSLIGALKPLTGGAASNPFGPIGALLNGWSGTGGSSTVSGGGTNGATSIPGLPDISSNGSAGGLNISQLSPGSQAVMSTAAAMLKTATKFGSFSTDFSSGMKNPFGTLFPGSDDNGVQLAPNAQGQSFFSYGGSTYNPNNPNNDLVPNSTSASSIAGAGVAIGGAGMGAYRGISQMSKGGAGNISGGLGTTLMSIAPLTGPAAPFIMAAGMAADLVSAILGDPKVNRANSIATQLQFSQFMAPVAQNVTMDTSGHYADTNFLGQARTSDLSPYPVTQKPYYDLNNNVMVPGRTISSFGAPVGPQSAPPAAWVIIQAMDSQSFQDWGTKNADALEHVMTNVVQRNSGAFISTTRNQLG